MTKITGFVAVVVLSIATPVSAITIDTTSNASGSASVGSGVDVNVTSETSVNSNTGSNADSETGVSVGSNGETVIVNSDELDEIAITITSSAAVASQNDLNAYARGVVKTNADIRDVILSETEVSVSHREHARIFGIFPAKVFARTHVKSNGEVTVKFPWYAFAAQKKATLESKVKASVKSVMPSVSANAEAQAKLSAQAQAAVLEKAVAAMKAEFDTDAAANASVN